MSLVERDYTTMNYQLHNLPTQEALKQDLIELAASSSRSVPASCLFIDLDKFKQVNDLHGHDAGNEVLEKVAGAIGSIIETKGRLYRWGGDEFFVVLPNFTGEEACATAERIRSTASELSFSLFPDKITLSIGVACCPLDGTTCDQLQKVADEGMYKSKDGGGNAVSSGQRRTQGFEPKERQIRTDIASRVDAVELWMSIVHLNSKLFTVMIENDNDEDIEVESFSLRVGSLYLSPPAKPRENERWVIGAHKRAEIRGEFLMDPTMTLAWRNPAMANSTMIELDLVAAARILGRLRRLSHTVLATASHGSISQFSL